MVERFSPYTPEQLNFIPLEYIAAYEDFKVTVREDQMQITRVIPGAGVMNRAEMLKALNKAGSEEGIAVARYFTQQELNDLRIRRDREIEELKQSGAEIIHPSQIKTPDPASLTLDDLIPRVVRRLASEALRDAPVKN